MRVTALPTALRRELRQLARDAELLTTIFSPSTWGGGGGGGEGGEGRGEGGGGRGEGGGGEGGGCIY